MYLNKTLIILSFLNCLVYYSLCQAFQQEHELDVISYHLSIEPEINKGSVKGTVMIHFQIAPNTNSIVLNSGNLQIDNVTGKNVIGFNKNNDKLIVQLSEREKRKNKITINYHGKPERGLIFNSESDHAYTVYFTSHWMVCNDIPSDKATLDLNILVGKEKKCVASGELVRTVEKEEKILFQWSQPYETPTYTYGFAIGNFNKVSEKQGDVQLNYYSQKLSVPQLKKVFWETGNIIQFFEQKSGVKYVQESYSQVLIGNHYQEMSGFSILKDSYGNLTLEDSTEINLISHELAHQWWGNRITCESWNHFWLNEAFAT